MERGVVSIRTLDSAVTELVYGAGRRADPCDLLLARHSAVRSRFKVDVAVGGALAAQRRTEQPAWQTCPVELGRTVT